MKYKVTIIIALIIITGGIFATVSFFPTEAQRRKVTRVQGNTGIIPVGPGQQVRLTVLNRGINTLKVQYRYLPYTPDPGCTPNDVTCICNPGNPDNSANFDLPAGQALSQVRTNFGNEALYFSFTIFLEGENPAENVVITTSIIDVVTGETKTQIWDDSDISHLLEL